MGQTVDTVLEQLITGAGGGVAVAAFAVAALSGFRQLVSKYLEARLIEPIRAKLSIDLEKYRAEQTETKRQNELFENIQVLEFPVLEEAGRVVHRIDELMHGKLKPMYAAEWDPSGLAMADLDGNKKVTLVYRLMRFYGAYRVYHQRSLSLPPHPARTRLGWVVEKKIDPVFASGGFPGSPVIFRDAIMEVSDEMLDRSAKWDAVALVQFGKWMELAKAGDSAISLVSSDLAAFFSRRSPRLALLGIYLIDLRQDLRGSREHERLRDDLLSMLREQVADLNSLSVWGRTATGRTDLAEMDLSKGMRPRNYLSPLYDKGRNLMNYPSPTSKETPPAAVVAM